MIFLFLYAVPYWGSLYFNKNEDVLSIHLSDVSVPYWGSLYFNPWTRRKAFFPWVSVPYWGSLYFNDITESHPLEKKAFPSPIGVLYISIVKGRCCTQYAWKFPSPIGVLYISILSSAALIITGLQSRIAVQNQIRLLPSEKLISNTVECQCFRASAQKSWNLLLFFIWYLTYAHIIQLPLIHCALTYMWRYPESNISLMLVDRILAA